MTLSPEDRLLAGDLAGAKPLPPAGWQQAMDAKFLADGPRRQEARPARRSWLNAHRGAMGALAAACAAAAVAVPALSGAGGPQAPRKPAAVAAAPSAPAGTEALRSDAARPEDAAPAAAEAGAASPQAAGRAQTRSAALQVSVKDAEQAAQQAMAAADRLGGWVISADIGSQARAGQAALQLAVPSGRLSRAMAALSGLGEVISRSQRIDDVTSQRDSLADQLALARAERSAALNALARARTAAAEQAARQRLAAAQAQLRTYRSSLASLRQKIATSSISLTLSSGRQASPSPAPSSPGGYTVAKALDAAGRILEAGAAYLILALSVLAPLAVLAGAAAWMIARRRAAARRAALDSPGR